VPNPIMQTVVSDSDGHRFKLDDLRGKVVVLSMWATWCGPCKVDMADLMRLAADHKDDKLLVLGLNAGNVDGGPEKASTIRRFKQKFNVNYDLVQATDDAMLNSFVRASRISAIPQTIVIGPDGELRGIFVGYGANASSRRRATVEAILANDRSK